MTSTTTDAIAEITSASHDNAEHGERGIRILRDFQHLEYGTKLYAHPIQCLLKIQEPAPAQAAQPEGSTTTEVLIQVQALVLALGTVLSPRVVSEFKRAERLLAEEYAKPAFQAAPAAAQANVWQQAIDKELVSSHLGVAGDTATADDAKWALHQLICWNIDVATNPATNGGKVLAAAAAPVVLPEPFALYDGEKWYANEEAAICSCANMQKLQKVYTEQQVRALLATATGLPAHVCKDSTPQLHVGDSSFEGWYAGYVKEGTVSLKQNCRDAYAAGMGDPLVVAAPQAQPIAYLRAAATLPEYGGLQVWKNDGTAFPVFAAPQAQADARDAELLAFLQDQCIDLRCFTTSDGEDVGWRTVQHHMSEPRERVVSEVYGDQPRRAIREAMARIERDPYCTGPLHLEDDAAIAAAKGG